jgi:hypothetical protein
MTTTGCYLLSNVIPKARVNQKFFEIVEIQIADVAVVRKIGFIFESGQNDRSPHEGPFPHDGILVIFDTGRDRVGTGARPPRSELFIFGPTSRNGRGIIQSDQISATRITVVIRK